MFVQQSSGGSALQPRTHLKIVLLGLLAVCTVSQIVFVLLDYNAHMEDLRFKISLRYAQIAVGRRGLLCDMVTGMHKRKWARQICVEVNSSGTCRVGGGPLQVTLQDDFQLY